MKYLTGKSFSIGGYSEQGGREYDRIFRKKKPRVSQPVTASDCKPDVPGSTPGRASTPREEK